MSTSYKIERSQRFRRVRRVGSFFPMAVAGMVTFLGLVSLAFFVDWGKASGLRIKPILVQVEQGEFVSQVLDQGEIQSSENIEIRCEARPRNGELNVIEVVPEGAKVKEGDFLVRLDSTSFEVELESQKIAVATAQTLLIQAEAELSAAEEALKEYEQGLFVEQHKLIENAIFDAKSLIETAKQEQTQAMAVLDHSKKLQAKGFITAQQLEANGFAVKRSEYALESAKNSLALAEQQLYVLENITRIKETVLLKSNIEAAKVKLNNQRDSLNVESTKLEEINQQIAKCEIRVPAGVEGQVVYAKEFSRRGQDWVLEEGASVRARQVLIRLPSPDKMEVKALINEQSITQIRPGMPTSIRVDALNNQVLTGVVTKVNQYAESSGWFGSSVRKYAVFVEILDPPAVLKPGMNASVSIETRYQKDALQVPVQAVYAVQNRHFCLLRKDEDEWDTREIEVDGNNTRNVLVTKGLQAGEYVVMNPTAYKEKMILPESKLETRIQLTDSLKSRVEDLQRSQTVSSPMLPGSGDTLVMASGDSKFPDASSQVGLDGSAPNFELPSSSAELIRRWDLDGDGLLSQDEVRPPFSFSFDQFDTNQDGFVDADEADKALQQMRQRMQSGSGGARQ